MTLSYCFKFYKTKYVPLFVTAKDTNRSWIVALDDYSATLKQNNDYLCTLKIWILEHYDKDNLSG